jgi:hypothetical protein
MEGSTHPLFCIVYSKVVIDRSASIFKGCFIPAMHIKATMTHPPSLPPAAHEDTVRHSRRRMAGRRCTRINEAEAEEVALLLTRSLRASMMEGSRTTEAQVLEACGEALEACGARRRRSDAGSGVRGGWALGCGTDGRRERER